MFRLTMLLQAIALRGFCAQAAAICTLPSLYSATISDLTAGLESGCFTSIDLVTTYLARIAEVNNDLNIVLELNPDALTIAASLDAERKNGTLRGPLHGLPILVKDNIATLDKMNNTAGSYALLGATVPRDSGTVKKLRDGGVIFLGKANLSQWAMYRSTNSTSGWTSRGGQTYGGYYPKMDPYGSSSGSAVAAALGLSFAAIGTETRGSILTPASKGNIVGIKPTVGLTSRYLVIPITLRQDTVGPLARTVHDAAVMLSVMAGVDEYDNYTSSIPNKGKLPDYVGAAMKVANLTGMRIGVPRNGIEDDLLYGNVNRTYMLSSFETALSVLRTLGAEIIENANFSQATHKEFDVSLGSSVVTNQVITCAAGFTSDLASYFSELTSNPNDLYSVANLRKYTAHDPREDFPDRDVGTWDYGPLALGYNTSDPRAYAAWYENQVLDDEGGVTGICNSLNLSAMVIPTEYAASWLSGPGLPAVSVPLGAYPADTPVQQGLRELIAVAPGIPFGLTFMGPKWSEETLIMLAAAFENATKYRDAYVIGANATMPTAELTRKSVNGTLPTSPAISAGGVARSSIGLICSSFLAMFGMVFWS